MPAAPPLTAAPPVFHSQGGPSAITPAELLSDFLPAEDIARQQAMQTDGESDSFAAKAKNMKPGQEYGGVVPLKLDLSKAATLDNDQPLDIKTRLGTFTIPLWLTAEVMTEIATRHESIEKNTEKPAGWTPTLWWDEVRTYLQGYGMPDGITARELLLFWSLLWDAVRGMGKASAPGA